MMFSTDIPMLLANQRACILKHGAYGGTFATGVIVKL